MLRAVGDGFLFPRKKRTPQKNDKEHALLVLSRADTCCLLYLLSTSNLQCITTNLLTATATQVLTRVEMFAKFKFETQCSQSSYFQTFQHSGTGEPSSLTKKVNHRQSPCKTRKNRHQRRVFRER